MKDPRFAVSSNGHGWRFRDSRNDQIGLVEGFAVCGFIKWLSLEVSQLVVLKKLTGWVKFKEP